jgi:hypothetical protein
MGTSNWHPTDAQREHIRRAMLGRKITWGEKISATLMGREKPRRPLPERFWEKVVQGRRDECWPWQGALAPNGYGVFRFDKRKMYAHRVAFFLANEQWPEETLHSCDRRACVNPAHLSSGNRRANMLDAAIKGRMKKVACLKGHPFDQANTGHRKNGTRFCRRCHADRMARKRASVM